ncbi:SRPBCC family protein [Paenibacillus xylanilyticus]|uniref:SRPBCC family protein n=1 Tax=Paenibacillus xylanilyticus TaxID=248903 RepID=UPI0039A29A79
MLAELKLAPSGVVARFEREWKHDVQKVWSFLTENDKLSKWFSELQIEDLREGGLVKFDMGDGTFEEMRITHFEPYTVLAYTWGEDEVRFELQRAQEGCQLVLMETIHNITSHTAKDLAGWHVCLDAIGALLDEHTLESREDEWKTWYKKYQDHVDYFQKNRLQ